MGDVSIGVVEACSGLSMLVIFFFLSAAVATLVPRPLWERLLVVVSAIPIALAANITRIIVTAVMHKVSHYWADLVFHDLAGYLMILLGLGLLWVELRLLSWMFPIREIEDPLKLAQKSLGKWR
jgi:exosortase/archaeosortase family protein